MHRLLMHDDDLAWPMCMYCVKEKELWVGKRRPGPMEATSAFGDGGS